ncbi:MAG: transcription termination factor NusA [Planctomycetaceae bacterium]|nr:transcription termination factor NusA [Planctomycetaceae bacterium]MBQ2820700.1 transcription termination factor NusA [Thermoguttaceae bacterium]
MNPSELLRIVDTIHRDKNIGKEVVFQGIEAALISAMKKNYAGDENLIRVHIDRETGQIDASFNGEPISPEEIAKRIGAQTAKQVMIQKIREAECDRVYAEYASQVNQLVVGTVRRFERESCSVSLPGIEAFLPRTEQIHNGQRGSGRNDSYRIGDRIRAIIAEVRKQGSRVKVILSRVRPMFVTRLFEQEIPEIGEGVIEIKSIARKAGVRSKIAVWSADQRVDCVGACVGMRGTRIKNICDELGGERIDIVPWSSEPIEFISNALQPAEIEEVILCGMLGRAIVLVSEPNLSLAIGRHGQNVLLASKLCGWDIEIMTQDELQAQLDRAVTALCTIPGVSQELAENLTGEGFTSYDDLSIIEPDALMEMSGLSEDEVNAIIDEAERRADEQDNQQNMVKDEQIQ